MLPPVSSALVPARHKGSWAKLGTHQGLLQIASRSPMRHCLVPSIRQHNASSSSPASKKVVAYVFRSLIGAVYLDSGRDREATSHALNALCRFLDSAQPPDQGPRLPSSRHHPATEVARILKSLRLRRRAQRPSKRTLRLIQNFGARWPRKSHSTT